MFHVNQRVKLKQSYVKVLMTKVSLRPKAYGYVVGETDGQFASLYNEEGQLVFTVLDCHIENDDDRVKLFEACEAFDFSYLMSDDYSATLKGRSAHSKLRLKADDKLKKDMIGAWNRYKTCAISTKPVIEDYL